MKRLFVSIAVIGLQILPVFVCVEAAQAFSLGFDSDGTLQSYTRLGDADPASIAFVLVNTALIFLGTATLILIIVAGFLWLTAAGSEEKITKAKDIMKGAIVGLVVVLGSYGLARYLFTAIRIATQSA